MQGPLTRTTIDEQTARIGQTLGVSDWITIDQPMVDTFATLTRDTYFIHIDPARAAVETPFGGSIAHGFLTLSLLSNMAYQCCPAIEGTQTGVNYGFNRLRFVSPVRTGRRVRGHFVLKQFEVKDRRWQSTWDVTVEIEGEPKPALVAEWVTAGLM